jgi:hypothetical protein
MKVLPVEAKLFHVNGWTDVKNKTVVFDCKICSTIDLSQQNEMDSIKNK